MCRMYVTFELTLGDNPLGTTPAGDNPPTENTPEVTPTRLGVLTLTIMGWY